MIPWGRARRGTQRTTEKKECLISVLNCLQHDKQDLLILFHYSGSSVLRKFYLSHAIFTNVLGGMDVVDDCWLWIEIAKEVGFCKRVACGSRRLGDKGDHKLVKACTSVENTRELWIHIDLGVEVTYITYRTQKGPLNWHVDC